MKQIILIGLIIFLIGCQYELPDEGLPVDKPAPAEFTECTERSDACTREYVPVCGIADNGIRCITEPCESTDAITFGNKCTACSDNDVYGYYEGDCVEQRFVVCRETQTGFDAEKFAEDSGGICVDICPGNYDEYITQIGVAMCIKHYGVEEINEWETCTKSSNSCECVKTYETTDNVEIEDAQYRCVPSQYAERMIFRSGVDRLDEKGERSVAIA